MTGEPEMLRQLRANVACLEPKRFGGVGPGTASFFSLEAQRDLLRWVDALQPKEPR